MDFRSLTEEPIFFTDEDAAAWDEMSLNRAGFAEAVATAHYVKRGYQVLRHFCTTDSQWNPADPLKRHSTQLMHEVVGEQVSHFLCSEVARTNPRGYGEPDLFVFREPD